MINQSISEETVVGGCKAEQVIGYGKETKVFVNFDEIDESICMKSASAHAMNQLKDKLNADKGEE